MTKGYSIFEWISSIPITKKHNDDQNEDNEITSTHEDDNDYDINLNGEEEEIIKGKIYEDDYPSYRGNEPSDNIIKNQDYIYQ